MISLITTLALTTLRLTLLLARYAVGSFGPIQWRLNHRWQLQFLVIRIITLLSGISLTVADLLHLNLVGTWRVWGSPHISYLLTGVRLT